MAQRFVHEQKEHHSPAVRRDRPSGRVHVIVDNSNLFIGAQLGQGERGKQDVSVRVNVGKVVQIIERGIHPDAIKTRFVGGSGPSREARVWREWEKCHYRCVLGERSANNEVGAENDVRSQQTSRKVFSTLLGSVPRRHAARSNTQLACEVQITT